MQAQQWVDDVVAAVRVYVEERRQTPVVKVTLVTGEARFVQKIEAGPNDRLITLNPYPDVDAVLANMVAVEQDRGGVGHVARDAIVVTPDKIMKVELLYDRPRDRPVGFVIPDDGGE